MKDKQKSALSELLEGILKKFYEEKELEKNKAKNGLKTNVSKNRKSKK